MGKGHRSKDCNSKVFCSKRQKKHPLVLHRDSFGESSFVSRSNDSQKGFANNFTTKLYEESNQKIACTILPVKIKVAGKNENVVVNAALDTSSSS